MAIEGHDAHGTRTRGTLRWPGGAPRARRPDSPALFAYLLDADDELAQGLDVRMRISARQLATARLLDADPGECDLGPWLGGEGHGPGLIGRAPGLLVLTGLVAVDTHIADRTVTELLGGGDLLSPAEDRVDELIERRCSWHVLAATRLAVLDDEFAERVRPWPAISHQLLRRAQQRGGDLAALRAISCQPRLDVRLVLLLWHLAARWGRVERSGIRLSLPLTHRLIGQLVAAERPSVTHALGRLAQADLVTGTPGDWHLHGSLDEQLELLTERSACEPPRRAQHESAAAGAGGGGSAAGGARRRVAR